VVYSLVASRLGPIAAEFTETETRSLQSELSGSVGANAGIAKSEVSSRMQAAESQGSQVLRKSMLSIGDMTGTGALPGAVRKSDGLSRESAGQLALTLGYLTLT
jgi:hypothetical protein